MRGRPRSVDRGTCRPDAAAHSALAASPAHLSSLSLEATWRCHLRQEPGAEVGLGVVWRRYSPGKLLAMPRRRLSVPTRANGGAFGKLGKWRCERVKPPSGRARTTTVREEQGQPRPRERRGQLHGGWRRHPCAAALEAPRGEAL